MSTRQRLFGCVPQVGARPTVAPGGTSCAATLAEAGRLRQACSRRRAARTASRSRPHTPNEQLVFLNTLAALHTPRGRPAAPALSRGGGAWRRSNPSRAFSRATCTQPAGPWAAWTSAATRPQRMYVACTGAMHVMPQLTLALLTRYRRLQTAQRSIRCVRCSSPRARSRALLSPNSPHD